MQRYLRLATRNVAPAAETVQDTDFDMRCYDFPQLSMYVWSGEGIVDSVQAGRKRPSSNAPQPNQRIERDDSHRRSRRRHGLNWSSDVTVVGTIASLAARLMGVVAQKMTDSFFECVQARLEQH